MEIKKLESVEWGTLERFPIYKFSNTGLVFSIKHNMPLALFLTGPKKAKYVTFSHIDNEGKRKNIKIHKIVAELFVPNPFNKKEVNHKDGNKLNNNASNLEYATHAENMKHAGETGLMAKGDNHYRSKLTASDISEIQRLLAAGESQNKIAELFKINQSVVSKLKNNKTRKHAYP